ncbi:MULTISPECIES: hypothetical protein [unclassified Ectothiorhodospira]|uniref:hypothetical protein n=1 Tax=unclassified Ectothiorhodospira TaxID=2684909 RepID=UPI001EE841ED|nr:MULTISPECIES: hypothetical protein [unclassified Ectothiorhodospira]MCG5517017.1 hypothetical protein [Ectothiorhodospira sp. 9100]MCG5520021.1 hypothetical protein [Ectothiorhodospira sp. 9905]
MTKSTLQAVSQPEPQATDPLHQGARDLITQAVEAELARLGEVDTLGGRITVSSDLNADTLTLGSDGLARSGSSLATGHHISIAADGGIVSLSVVCDWVQAVAFPCL